MAHASIEEGDAPLVRDLILEHYRDGALEVEGKLGHRSRGRFVAGIRREQFAALEEQLCRGNATLGAHGGAMPSAVVTVDRFYGTCGPGQPKLRASYTCSSSGQPEGQPSEVICKSRLSDCRVACHLDPSGSRPSSPVDLRVSFSREVAIPQSGVEEHPFAFERHKSRRTWEAPLWLVQLTHVLFQGRETFEVEVELRMPVVRARLEASEHREEEALHITRELVAVLRCLSCCAAEVEPAVTSQKRRRQECLEAAEADLKAIVSDPGIAAELRQCVLDGAEAMHQAKRHLCDVLRESCSSVDERLLFRYAGQQIARELKCRQQAALKSTVEQSNSKDEATASPPAVSPSSMVGSPCAESSVPKTVL